MVGVTERVGHLTDSRCRDLDFQRAQDAVECKVDLLHKQGLNAKPYKLPCTSRTACQ